LENKKKIVFNYEPLDYSKKAIELWKKNKFQYIKNDLSLSLSKDDFLRVEVLIVRLKFYIGIDIISKFPNLKTVISATTGSNHLDIELFNLKNIELITLRGHSDFLKEISSTAELTWALIMSISRNIFKSVEHVRNSGWNRDLFKGYQLRNKSIGIIGLGRIGLLLAQYAKAFGMSVYYFDPYVSVKNYKKMDSINNLASKVDFLSIHIHPDKENFKIINEKVISSMPKRSYLINTSRGELWDEEAVVKYLKNGHLSGVACDVLFNETELNKGVLWRNRNLYNIIITPHIGGATYDAMWKCEEFLQHIYLSKN